MGKTTTLHIVQPLATPHNNSLIQALRDQTDLRVLTWYAQRTSSRLPWGESLGGRTDTHYLDNWPDRLRLVGRFLFRPSENFMVIGYASAVPRFIIIASWLLRRRYMYWTDNPRIEGRSWFRSLLSRIMLHFVKSRACPFFVVGREALERFNLMGLPRERLINLPIFVDLAAQEPDGAERAKAVRHRYGVHPEEVLFVAASRLTYDKGYDLLVKSVSHMAPADASRLRVLIVGAGPEEAKLQVLTEEAGVQERVIFESWLEPEAYLRVIGAADVFVHPARFDAFGGGTLNAMALGVPVIGSDHAGAVLERVRHGVNGLTYRAEDTQALADAMLRMMNEPAERRRMGELARATAEEWPPSRGASIIREAL